MYRILYGRTVRYRLTVRPRSVTLHFIVPKRKPPKKKAAPFFCRSSPLSLIYQIYKKKKKKKKSPFIGIPPTSPKRTVTTVSIDLPETTLIFFLLEHLQINARSMQPP